MSWHFITTWRIQLILFAIAIMLAEDSALAAPPARNFVVSRMNGENEVPARISPARGTAVFNLSPDGQTIHYRLTVTRISNVVGAHIHSGAEGVNGPIVFGFYGAAAGGGSHNGLLAHGKIERGVTPLPPSLGPGLNGSQRFDALVALMQSGQSYVNVHTNDGISPTNTGPGDFPGGEIRGQIDPRP